jgi:hypothetical protein
LIIVIAQLLDRVAEFQGKADGNGGRSIAHSEQVTS